MRIHLTDRLPNMVFIHILTRRKIITTLLRDRTESCLLMIDLLLITQRQKGELRYGFHKVYFGLYFETFQKTDLMLIIRIRIYKSELRKDITRI